MNRIWKEVPGLQEPRAPEWDKANSQLTLTLMIHEGHMVVTKDLTSFLGSAINQLISERYTI